MAFCDAFATYSVCPSGVTVTAFGELPSSDSRPRPAPPTCSVFATASVAVSIADTVSLLALVTYRRSPAGLHGLPGGGRPTANVFTTALLALSNTHNVPVIGMPGRRSTTTRHIPST